MWRRATTLMLQWCTWCHMVTCRSRVWWGPSVALCDREGVGSASKGGHVANSLQNDISQGGYVSASMQMPDGPTGLGSHGAQWQVGAKTPPDLDSLVGKKDKKQQSCTDLRREGLLGYSYQALCLRRQSHHHCHSWHRHDHTRQDMNKYEHKHNDDVA